MTWLLSIRKKNLCEVLFVGKIKVASCRKKFSDRQKWVMVLKKVYLLESGCIYEPILSRSLVSYGKQEWMENLAEEVLTRCKELDNLDFGLCFLEEFSKRHKLKDPDRAVLLLRLIKRDQWRRFPFLWRLVNENASVNKLKNFWYHFDFRFLRKQSIGYGDC